MISKKLTFNYRGERNYVHGTDIHTSLVKLFKTLGYNHWQYFELTIKNTSQHNLLCTISESKQKNVHEIANFQLICNNKTLFGSLCDDPRYPITTRKPFDEYGITKNCELNRDLKLIKHRKESEGYSEIELIVIMAKSYCEKVVDSSAKWFYRKTKFYKTLESIDYEYITIKETRKKGTIVEFSIYFDEEFVGNIYGASI